MAEIMVPGDVEAYTQGRLNQSNPETQRALDAALAKARRYCGWHVSPVRQDTIIMDRPQWTILVLPTLHIVSVDSVTIDGVPVPLDNVRMSREAPGILATKDSRPWGGYPLLRDPGYGAMSVTITHGYTAAEAADFREAVLRTIDTANLQVGTGVDGPVEEIKVDDVGLSMPRRGGPDRLADTIARNPMDTSTLYQYRILAI